MTVMLLAALALTSGGLGLLVRRRRRSPWLVGLTGFLVVIVAGSMLPVGSRTSIGGDSLISTAYLRLFVELSAVAGAALTVVAASTRGPRSLPGLFLVWIGAATGALALVDPLLAVLVLTTGSVVAVLASIEPESRNRVLLAAGALRAVVVAGLLAAGAVTWAQVAAAGPSAGPAAESVLGGGGLGLAFLASVAAVALRGGAIPIHVWSSRLTDALPAAALPLALAWGPAALAIVVMGWANDQVGPLSQPLELERAIVTALALGSVLMGALAAFLHDDLKRIVSYSLVGDIGVVLLAMAALDQETWGPARTWILAYVVVKTAFAAWAATVEATYGTRQIHNLTGWARRSPLLAGGLGVIALAAVGLPGLASFDARARLMELALDPPLSAFAALGALGSIAYFGRIFAAGFGRPTAEVAQALNLMPHWPGDRPTRLWPDLAVQLRGAWRVNRGPAAATAVLVLALLGLTVAAGGLGGPAAAAGLGPAAAGR